MAYQTGVLVGTAKAWSNFSVSNATCVGYVAFENCNYCGAFGNLQDANSSVQNLSLAYKGTFENQVDYVGVFAMLLCSGNY